MILLRPLGVERQTELLLPVELVARSRQCVVAIAGTLPPACHIGCMRGDLVRDYTFTNVVCIRKSEMLLGRHVAQHVRPEPADHCCTDGARDVIVARRDVGHERPQRVEGRFVADPLRSLHVHLDLVHRDVSGPFDHHLDVALPCAFGELAHRIELGELRAIAGVCKAPRTQRVANRDRHIVLAQNLENFIEMLI